LNDDIRISVQIVPEIEATCKRGAEYRILFYSEKRDNFMIGIAQMPADKFRKDMFKAKRKPLYEIWSGDTLGVGEIARFAPSACNTQPWIVEKEEDRLLAYRYKKPGKRGIMPAARVAYYNRIDMGIFQLILEICLVHEGWGFERILYMEDKDGSAEKVLTAEYRLAGQRSLKK